MLEIASRFLARVAAVASMVVAAAAPGSAAPAPVDRGLRFDSPGVLDLAERSLQVSDGKALAISVLDGADAQRILAAPAQGENEPVLRFSDDEYGCSTVERGRPARKCALQHENGLIAAAGPPIKRAGKRLTIVPTGAGAALTFIDWKEPATKNGDGDEETHWYLGRLPGSGYERVEVQFGHDAPGNFLINPRSGKVAFVHNGADLVAPSPDGQLLVTWNALNPPFSLRVAALDRDGPRLTLQCSMGQSQERLTPVFKGWTGEATFAFVLEYGAAGEAKARVAARVRHDGTAWTFATNDVGRLAALDCHAEP